MQICTRDTLSAFRSSILSIIFTLDNFFTQIDRGGVLAVHCQPALPYHIDYPLLHIRIHNPSPTRMLRLNRLNASAFDVPSGTPRASVLVPAIRASLYHASTSHQNVSIQQVSSSNLVLCVPRARAFSSAQGTIPCISDRPL